MSKAHFTLRPAVNLVLTLMWGGAAFLLVLAGASIAVVALGLLCGVAGGFMQWKGMGESRGDFLGAQSMLEVRRAFKATKWGRRYLYCLWLSLLLIVGLGVWLGPNPVLNVGAGYLAFMFARELITLERTFELHRLRASSLPNLPA